MNGDVDVDSRMLMNEMRFGQSKTHLVGDFVDGLLAALGVAGRDGLLDVVVAVCDGHVFLDVHRVEDVCAGGGRAHLELVCGGVVGGGELHS